MFKRGEYAVWQIVLVILAIVVLVGGVIFLASYSEALSGLISRAKELLNFGGVR